MPSPAQDQGPAYPPPLPRAGTPASAFPSPAHAPTLSPARSFDPVELDASTSDEESWLVATPRGSQANTTPRDSMSGAAGPAWWGTACQVRQGLHVGDSMSGAAGPVCGGQHVRCGRACMWGTACQVRQGLHVGDSVSGAAGPACGGQHDRCGRACMWGTACQVLQEFAAYGGALKAARAVCGGLGPGT